MSDASCAWCGGPLNTTWVDTSLLGGSFQTTSAGYECRPGCVPRCPICHREPGDIHGPDCGSIIAGKLGDLAPCTITRADCGERQPRRGRSLTLDAIALP